MPSIYVFRNRIFYRKMDLASTPDELAKGLLGRTSAGRGLFLMGADAIHTYGMKFPIDVVYLHPSGLVIGLEERLQPNREGKLFAAARHIVELNPGTIQRSHIKVGEQWSWRKEG